MSRPCRWPDGGCGAEVMFVRSAASAATVVLDPNPVKGIVLERRSTECPDPQCGDSTWDHECQLGFDTTVARVVDIYTDHQATCPKFATKVERERAAKAAKP